MRRSIYLLAMVLVAGCTEAPNPASSEPTAEASTQPSYDHRDGMAYGYTLAETESGQQAGRAAQGVTMLLYAGQRNGVHQLHMRQGAMITAIECAYPCGVMKIMVAAEGAGTLNVQHYRPEPNAVAMLALQDAHNGHLEKYFVGDGKQRRQLWVDEKAGIESVPFQ